MKVVVGHHDFCFDGVASAALFTRLHRQVEGRGHEYVYHGLSHGPTKPTAEFLDGDQGVVVDYAYFGDPRLHWWFDHHPTAFKSPEDEARFRADASGRQFFDPDSKSCAKLIAEIGRKHFGMAWSYQEELIEIANVIDGALYATAAEAAEIESAGARLRLVVESGQRELLMTVLAGWIEHPLSDVAAIPAIRAEADRLVERELAARAAVRECGRAADAAGRVVILDLADRAAEGYSKLFVYAAYPDASYTVTLIAGKDRTKIGIGFNPWCGRERRHDVSEICRRHGGGGHPVVGAISLPAGEIEAARKLAKEIAAELAS